MISEVTEIEQPDAPRYHLMYIIKWSYFFRTDGSLAPQLNVALFMFITSPAIRNTARTKTFNMK